MSVLRETTKKKIMEALEKTYFTASSFSVKFNESETAFLVITFIPEKKFSFSVSEASGYNASGYVTSEAPGIHIETGEDFAHKDLTSALKTIASWAERIHEDYRAKNPLIDELDSFKQALAEKIDSHVHDKQAHFTVVEADALRKSLDELAAQMGNLTEKGEANERKLEEARAEIERIKADLNIFPKGVWYRVTGAKVLTMVKKIAGSSEGKQFALDAAKKLFLDGPK